MKYTNYILHGSPIRPDELGIVAIPAAIAGIPMLCGFLCGAIVMDSGRYAKLHYLLYLRKQRQLKYIKCVLRSLNRIETKQLINLLKLA